MSKIQKLNIFYKSSTKTNNDDEKIGHSFELIKDKKYSCSGCSECEWVHELLQVSNYETIESSIKDKIDLVSLPTEEFVPFIATENGHWEGMEFFRYYKFERVLTEETEEKQIIIKVANKMRSPERINEVINIIEDVSGNIDYEEEVKKLEDCRENLEVFLLENYIEGPVVCEECEK